MQWAIQGEKLRAGFGLGGAWVTMLLATTVLVGCGSDQSEAGSNRSMVRSKVVERTTSGASNHAPSVDELVIKPNQPSTGRLVQAAARVSDVDGDPTNVVFRWQTNKGRVLGEGRTFDTSGLAPGSRLEVIAVATDGVVESASVVHAFSLSTPMLAISLVAIDASEGTKPGALLRAVVELENDVSGRAEPDLVWKVNGKIVGEDDELETKRFLPGDIVILRAQLDQGTQRSRPVSSSPLILTRGGAPEILSKPLAGIEGGVFRYQIRARSEESDATLTYALLKGPDGMRVGEKSGMVEWRPESAQRGRFDIEVSATDQWGSGAAQSFAIVAESPTAPPASAR